MQNKLKTMIKGINFLIAFLIFITAFTVANISIAQSDNVLESIDFTSGLNLNQKNEYNDLTHSLRCLVCQNQSIAESNAPLAMDLREQVRDQLLDGKSSQEIKQFMVDRYGDFVLYKPPFTITTMLLWLGPILLFFLAAIWLIINIRKHNQTKHPILNTDQVNLARELLTQKKSNKDNQ